MKRLSAMVFTAALSVAPICHAGIYTDDLTRCVVDATTDADRINLMKWLFVAMSVHPTVATLYTAKPDDIDKVNKTMGELLTRLLTEACTEKARAAVRIEGPNALRASFQVLGQVAAVGLFSDPAVAKAMSGLEKYTDKQKLEQLAKPEAAAPGK